MTQNKETLHCALKTSYLQFAAPPPPVHLCHRQMSTPKIVEAVITSPVVFPRELILPGEMLPVSPAPAGSPATSSPEILPNNCPVCCFLFMTEESVLNISAQQKKQQKNPSLFSAHTYTHSPQTQRLPPLFLHQHWAQSTQQEQSELCDRLRIRL